MALAESPISRSKRSDKLQVRMLESSHQPGRQQVVCGTRCNGVEASFFFRPLAFALVLFILALSFDVNPISGRQITSIRRDDSDWWSTLTAFNMLDLSAPNTNTLNRAPANSNFEIVGVVAGPGQIQELAAKIGKAPVVGRGDGANSRVQVCYSSPGTSQVVHLVFEQDGEGFGYSFYLFEDGLNWNGSDLCVKSRRISASLLTGSGLQLGQTISQVRAILGNPSTVLKDKLAYVYEVQRRTTASDLEKTRRAYPNLSDKEIHDSFASYYLDAYIEARFVASKLTYLAITKSKTYP